MFIYFCLYVFLFLFGVTVIGAVGSTPVTTKPQYTPRSRSNKIAPLKQYIELQKGKPIKDSTAKKAFKKNVILTTSSDTIAPLDSSDQIPRAPSNESLTDSASTTPQPPPPINTTPTPVFRRRSKKENALDQSMASPSIIEALIHRLSRRRVIPWIGAGVTYNIYGGWEGVVKLLWEEAGQLDDYERARQTEDLTVLAQFGCSNLKMQGKDMWSSIEHKFKEFERKAAEIPEDRDKHISANPNAVDNVSESGESVTSTTTTNTTTNNTNNNNGSGRKKKRNSNNNQSGPTKYSMFDTTLQDLQPLVCGPWPALLTTNWDAMLEQSYQAPWISKSSANEVKISKFALREGTHLPVRFREDVHLFYAELKSQRRPPMLLKLHGDFSERGRKELVLSHADYRAVMVRDISLNELLRQLSSEYSFLFIGTSLRDRDLLGILDEVSEGLGGGIGPHFWLTPDEVSPTRVQHLQMNFNIQTIHFDPTLPFMQRIKLTNKALKEIAALGWVAPTPQMPYFLQNKLNVSKEEKKVYDGVNFSPFKKIVIPVGDFAQVRILNQVMDTKTITGHVAASVGVIKRQDRYVLANVFGSQVLASLLRHDRKKLEELHLLNGALGVDVPKYGGVKRMGTISNRFQLWLLCGTEATGGGSPGRIFKAVKSFLKHGIKCYEQGSIVDKHGNKRLKFSLPLLASGGGHTTSKLSLCATLSAIGYFLGVKFKGLPDDSGVTGIDLDIYIALKNEHNPNNVLADISEGRLKPHSIMASSSKGMMHFRVIHIKLNEHHIVRQVWMRIDGTIADLMKELGIALTQSWDIELRLGSGRYARVCQITEEQLDQPLFKWGIAEEALVKVSTRFKGLKPTREEYNSDDKEDDSSISEDPQI